MFFPLGLGADNAGQQLCAAVVQVAVKFPGKAHAAVGLDVLPGDQVVGIAGADPGGGGGQRQVRCIAGQGAGAVIGVGTGQFQGDEHVGELVLDGLERGDGRPKA